MIIDIITIFPGMFSPIVDESIIKRARNKGLLKIILHNLRDYSDDPHKKIDAPPYGGGPGMVFKPDPLFEAVESILGYRLYPKSKEKKTGKRELSSSAPKENCVLRES